MAGCLSSAGAPACVRTRRAVFWVTIVLIRVWGIVPANAEEPAPSLDAKKIEQLKLTYRADAGEYSIFRDTAGQQKLELREEPVYNWTNNVRNQYGSVFVWTWHGRPEVIASIFANPAENGERQYVHELLSLSEATLQPRRMSEKQWQPKAGVKRATFSDWPKPASAPRLRLIQMRDLANEFAAHSVNPENRQKWELRLLSQPLYRYQSTDQDLIDGALFAYVTSAGTDPEVILILEAAKAGTETQWNYALGRFSDHNLYVSRGDKPIWSSERSDTDTWANDAQHLYQLHVDRSTRE